MVAQAFFYNAIFFTHALILTDFYGVRSDHVGYYLLPFAAGNFLGPVLIGRLFDTQGRRLPEVCTTIHVQGARGRPETRVRANRRSGPQTKPQTVQAPHYQQKDNERHCAH
jgi:hypothetical protein